MLAWLVNLIWLSLLSLIWPWLLYRRYVLGKSLGNVRQKLLGQVPGRSGTAPCIWFHAVSVGEVLQLPQIVQEMSRRIPGLEVVISTTTVSGQQVALSRFPQATVVYWPLDFSWAVQAALERIRPSLIVLVELELWPNFLVETGRRSIPVAVINGRVTERSVRGYRRIAPVIRWMLSKLSLVAAQNETYSRRFLDLGLDSKKLCVTGSIKFDGVETDRANSRTVALAEVLGIAPGEPVFVAGSTHAPEERLAIEAWLSARRSVPELRLIVVPRHQERFDEVASLIENDLRLSLVRRSKLASCSERWSPESGQHLERPVILLDTLGELGACWGLADLAFVGGSLTNRGGQSMIEPAAYGACLLFGPNTWNFSEIVERLLASQGAVLVRNGLDLTARLEELLVDRPRAEASGRRARALVLESQGATARTADRLLDLMRGPTAPGCRHPEPGADERRAAA